MKLLVNADDFGNDESRTNAICEAFDRRLITSTTAMVNCPWFPCAMDVARKSGFAGKVGLHFNLTEGRPLSESMRRDAFFCSNGVFTGKFHLSTKTRFILPANSVQALKDEAEAQFRRFLDCGGTLKHLDSHHHVHTDLAIARIVLPMAKRLGFRSVRLSLTMGASVTGVKRGYKWLFNRGVKMCFPGCTNEFATFEGLECGWRTLPQNARVEVMVHPRHLNGQLVDAERPMSDFEMFLKGLQAAGAEVVSYAD